MNFFFDANISERISNMLAAYCEDKHAIIHIRQHEDFSHNNTDFGNNTPDVEYIDKLRQSNKHWNIISGDSGIIDTPHERAALLASGLTFFCLDHNWSKARVSEQAWKIVKIWSEIETAAKTQGQALYRVHMGKRMRVEPIRSGMRARGGPLRG